MGFGESAADIKGIQRRNQIAFEGADENQLGAGSFECGEILRIIKEKGVTV